MFWQENQREEDGNLNELKWASFLLPTDGVVPVVWALGRLATAGKETVGRNERRGDLPSLPPDGLLLPLVQDPKWDPATTVGGSRATSLRFDCRTRRLVHVRNPAAPNSFTLPLPVMHLGREGGKAPFHPSFLSLSLLQFFRVMNMCVEMGGKEQRRAERERQVNSASKYHCAAHCTHARDVPAQHEFTSHILRLGLKSLIMYQ